MNKHKVDYNSLAVQVERKQIPLNSVQHRIEKVAFDVVRFKDGDEGARLWKIESSADGDFIVPLYDELEEETVKTASAWEAHVVKASGMVHFSYKGTPITKIAAETFNVVSDKLEAVVAGLPQKLATNPKLVKALLKEMPQEKRTQILRKYPEIA